MASPIDRVPRLLRPIIGLAAAAFMLWRAGLVHVPTSLGTRWVSILVYGVGGLGAASVLYVVLTLLQKKLRRSWESVTRNVARDGINNSSLAVFRVYPLAEGAEDAIKKLLRERASRAGLRYAVVSVFNDEGADSLLLIRGIRKPEVEIEEEVLKSIAQVLGKFRVEPVNTTATQCLSALFELSLPRRRNEGLVVLDRASRVGVVTERSVVYVGFTVNTPVPHRIAIPLNDMDGHVAIFGSTGSGKSTTAAALACRLAYESGVNVVVLDWTGEHRVGLGKCGATIVNPTRDGISLWPGRSISADVALEVLSLALDLTPPQEYLLFRALEGGVPDSFLALVERVERVAEESRWDREVKRGLLRRLGIIARSYPQLFEGSSMPEYRGLVVIDLSSISLTTARKAAALLLLAREYQIRRDSEEARSKSFFVVEEAHNILVGPDTSFADTLISESRKYGMHLVIVTQSPFLMPNSIILNSSVKIIHALRSQRDKDLVVSSLGLSNDLSSSLDKLGVGEALVYSPSLGEPVIVRVELPHPLR